MNVIEPLLAEIGLSTEPLIDQLGAVVTLGVGVGAVATIWNEPVPGFSIPAYVQAKATVALPVPADVGTVQDHTQAPGCGWLGLPTDALVPFGYFAESVQMGPTGALSFTFALDPRATGSRMPTV